MKFFKKVWSERELWFDFFWKFVISVVVFLLKFFVVLFVFSVPISLGILFFRLLFK